MKRILFFLILIPIILLSACSDTTDDGPVRLEHVRNLRYCAITAFKEKNLREYGYIYTSIGLSKCTSAQLHHFNIDVAKEQLNVTTARLDGPYYATMDTIIFDPKMKTAPVITLDGIDMKLRADIEPYVWDLATVEYYKPDIVKRNAIYIFNANTMVYELIAPDGDIYVMFSYSHAVNHQLKMSDLSTLEKQLSLPIGWQYRARQLSETLTVKTDEHSEVTKDNLANIYQRINH